MIVVGAGPAGTECAQRLAAGGFQVMVVEEHARPGEPVHCTGVLSAQAYRAFELPQSAIQSELTVAELVSPGGITLRVPLNGSHAYAVDRGEVDRALAARAEQAGARFCFQTRVTALATGDRGVTVSGRRLGEPWEERARVVVLATGARSRLPQQAGMAGVHEDCHGAQMQVRVESPPVIRVWLGQRVAPGGFGWAVPAGPGWSRVGVLTRGQPRGALAAVARRALPEGAGMDPEAVRLHPIPAAPRRPTFGERALSVGDAAGQVKMTTGGGVYYGLLASRIACEVLAERLAQERLGARHLARYERLWQELLGPEQRAGQLLRRIACELPDDSLDEVFRLAEARGLSRYVLDLVDFDWHAGPAVGLALTVLSATPEERGLRWLKRLLS